MNKSILTALMLVTATAVQAQDAAYVDDRSSAASLVRSLYNAVNRKEFGRAWAYFGEEKPAKTFDDYASGFKSTSKVNVHVGQVTSEGAAGSTFFNIPVAIESTEEGKEAKVFTGCYTARLANPQIQGEQFQPLHLVKGTLQPSDKSLTEAAPETCGEGGQPGGDDAVLAQAKAAFIAANSPSCDFIDGTTGLPEREIENNTIKYKAEGDAETDPEREVRLIAFPCFMGAYNTSTIYYIWSELDGLHQLSFATPVLDIQYEDPDNTESKVKSITVTGFTADDQLINSEFDAKTTTIMSWSKWRGVGDASSNGTWAFKDGKFVLVKFDVDASYDGEIDAQTVVDYDTAP